MAVLVIKLPLLGVGKYLIGLGRFLELILGFFIARIPVRMVLERAFSIRLFDLFSRG